MFYVDVQTRDVMLGCLRSDVVSIGQDCGRNRGVSRSKRGRSLSRERQEGTINDRGLEVTT
jgi:hypothetical protein